MTKAHLHQHLAGLFYPAGRDEILAYARNKGAPPGLIDLFESLPNRPYRHEAEVLTALGVRGRSKTRYNLRLRPEIVIPGKYRQFEDGPTLVVVAGKNEAVLYRAHRGRLTQVKAHKIPKPHYSDTEGHFKLRSRAGVIKSGGSHELHDERSTLRQFLHDFKGLMKRAVNPRDFESVYVLAPSQASRPIVESLPSAFSRKLAGVIEGNYVRFGPRRILEKVAVPAKLPLILTKPEAQRILEKSRQARKFIRRRSS